MTGLGTAWRTRRSRLQPTGVRPWSTVVVAAVRIDFGDGSHDFGAPRETAEAARLAIPAIRRFWRRGPLTVIGTGIVEISLNDLLLHGRRPGCKSPSCVKAAAEVAAVRESGR